MGGYAVCGPGGELVPGLHGGEGCDTYLTDDRDEAEAEFERRKQGLLEPSEAHSHA